MKIKPPADVTDFQRKNCAGTNQNPDAMFICAKAKRQQQLRQGEIDTLLVS
ncbi:hypothetical protein ABFY48_00795 [Lysinibacillus pakistanensis]|uniref:hypothetical protein n=1 Tax=Lysinibacillus pakistanensis TaxID=759811 RepID=UPI003D2BB0BF